MRAPLFADMKRLAACVLLAALPAMATEPVDFSRDVLPILSAHCFKCHGRDEAQRKGKLRLDVRADALAARDDFRPIVPGKPAESELLLRVMSKDEDERMPPADAGRPLTAAETQTLRDWIAQGADYTEHWAFIAPRRAPLPAVVNTLWPQTPIDRFVLARLEAEKFQPAARASRETLIRRATLDLIGLPPTPEEIETFLADQAPDAYAKLVDRLLASPQYGERYGRHWLDVARYADSGGFETDLFFGHAYRYRDYVIRSFNADKPFDRFIKEQIAGDELFPGDADARLATGLYTTGPVLQEAGMVAGKLEYDQNTDWIDTTGAAFLGLTLACARCHDHKYDPLSQREYFSLQAIFAPSDQFDYSVEGKKLRDRAALKTTLKEFEAEQARLRAQRESDPGRREVLLRKAGEAFIENTPALKTRVENSKKFDAIRHAVERFHRNPGANHANDALVEQDGDDNNLVVALKAELQGLLRGHPAGQDETGFLNIGIVALLNPLPTPRTPARVAATASAPAPVALPAPTPRPTDAAPTPPAGAKPGAIVLPPPSPRNFSDGGLNNRRAFDALTTDDEKRAFLSALGRQQIDRPQPAGYVEDLEALRLDLGQKHQGDASALPIRVLDHREKPLAIHLLKRGELETPGEAVAPGLPERFADGFDFDFATIPPERHRSALAAWIASDKNLLTARVIANRVWQWHFGEGLVPTPNDFGIRGERPTHPALLDWLAIEFVAHGWSIKYLNRLIMLSSTYQMAATADAATLERDPANRLLTRFQPHRLQAEVVWDSIRAASGTLDRTMFGLPIAPPLDEQEQIGNHRKWPASTPDEANRRAIYILVRRSFRFPMLAAFDLPDNTASCGRRDITTVPNQALTLMNNRTMREQADAFAERLLRETQGDLAALPARAWLHAYGRSIANDERARVAESLRARADTKAAVSDLCLALFNTNEFIYQQ
jgi:hypothetical protein